MGYWSRCAVTLTRKTRWCAVTSVTEVTTPSVSASRTYPQVSGSVPTVVAVPAVEWHHQAVNLAASGSMSMSAANFCTLSAWNAQDTFERATSVQCVSRCTMMMKPIAPWSAAILVTDGSTQTVMVSVRIDTQNYQGISHRTSAVFVVERSRRDWTPSIRSTALLTNTSVYCTLIRKSYVCKPHVAASTILFLKYYR